MPRSVSIHPDRKQTVEDALKRNGFLTQGDFAVNIEIALSTVSKFFNGKSVYISKFELICEALGLDKQEIQRPLESSQDKAVKETLEIIPTLYNPEKWVGRSQLIEMLLNQFQQNTRIVWLTGLSGIGKTTLGECIAVKDWESDPSFQWLHIEISASQLPDFATGAREILSQLGEKELDPQEMNDPKRLSDRLLKKLQSSFYWFQIDAIEKLIEANEFIDSYWLTFLESCLNTNHFSSRLLLTSQVLPNSLINWCDRFSNIWHQETLKGLENEESQQYFAKNGIVISEFNQDILTRIGQTYEGHPLVLQVITGEILQIYQGDVTAYWQVNQAEFEQVLRELKSSRLTETDYNEQLSRRVRERVKKSLEQLPEKAIALLCRSAVYRRPVLKKFWLGLITEYSPKEQIEAYRVLGDRALIETERNLIRLHNLVRDIAYNWLRENEIIWKDAEVKAAELWLNEYQPEENAENLEKVRSYLEAFYHYYNVENWEETGCLFNKSVTLFMTSRSNKVVVISHKTQSVHQHLKTWGYYNESIALCRTILERTNQSNDIECWINIGNCYFCLSDYSKAEYSYLQGLAVSKKINDLDNYANFLGSLGLLYNENGLYEQSKILFKQALIIHARLNNEYAQSVSLTNLGLVCQDLGLYKEALKYYKMSLDLKNTLNTEEGLFSLYNNIGVVLCELQQYNQSVEFHNQALSISKINNNPLDQSSALANLGVAYMYLDEYNQALECLNKALIIAEDIDSLMGKANILGDIGSLYRKRGMNKEAIFFTKEAIKIFVRLKNKMKMGIGLNNLAGIFFEMEEYDQAINDFNLSLAIFHELESPPHIAQTLKNLAGVYYTKKQLTSARQHCEQALQIATELGIPLAQKCQELLSKIEEAQNNEI
jgi:tetratricopeptide (TPR) repeat protein